MSISHADAALYATPEYIAEIGNQARPDDLQYAEFVNMDFGLTGANFPLHPS